MLTYTGARNLYGNLTNDSTSDNLTLGDTLMNEALRQICSEHAWDFLEKSSSISTAAGTQFYNLPYDYLKLIHVTITIGSTKYSPLEVPNRKFWDILNQTTSVQSDIPQYFFIFNNQIGFYPTPASTTSNAITVVYRRKVIDLNVADYTTGTIDVITNGSTSVTGSGTTWTTPMANRYLRVTRSNTAASSGDHFWYEIASVGSATTLTLTKSYQGTSLTTGAGATYTIGQVSPLPEEYQMLPVYHAARAYFSTKNLNNERYNYFDQLYSNLFLQLHKDHGRKSTNVVVLDDNDPYVMNPNLAPSL